MRLSRELDWESLPTGNLTPLSPLVSPDIQFNSFRSMLELTYTFNAERNSFRPSTVEELWVTRDSSSNSKSQIGGHDCRKLASISSSRHRKLSVERSMTSLPSPLPLLCSFCFRNVRKAIGSSPPARVARVWLVDETRRASPNERMTMNTKNTNKMRRRNRWTASRYAS